MGVARQSLQRLLHTLLGGLQVQQFLILESQLSSDLEKRTVAETLWSHRTKELGSEARHQEREQRQKQESQPRQGQPFGVVRAAEMFRVRLTRVCGLPTRLAATMHGQARRCLECVAGQKARAQTYANRHKFPNKNLMNAITKLLLSKSAFGIKHKQFVRHITLGDLPTWTEKGGQQIDKKRHRDFR